MTALPTTDRLPSDLLDYDQWVCWQTETRDGKQTKIPIDPSTGRYASATDPETWTNFDRACEHARATSSAAGIGFVFTDDDPFVGVDLDDCRTGDAVAGWATDIIERLDSYTEISPSETGYHIIARGSLPAGPNRRGGVECYETARYFTVTGDSVHDPPRPVADRLSELAAVHAEYVADDEPTDGDEHNGTATEGRRANASNTGLDDETVLEKAMSATNSAKFERLWNGSTSGYDSQSEADMALCFHLAFWTGGDTAQIDRLFRRSGLMRAKWDEVHFADGSTYGQKTVERAVHRVDDFYEPTESTSNPRPDGTTATRDERLGPRLTSQHPTPVPRNGASATDSDPRLLDIIDRLEARIERLEAQNETLRTQLENARRESATHRRETAGETTAPTESASIWTRVLSRFDS
jgi:primase-polymerase (primpol)-like protein